MGNLITTILTSASVSAALTAVIVWLTKNWIGERIKGSITHEYNQKLESYKSQLKKEHDQEIERLKAELGEVSSERNARRDYEYEARKKLYSKYEPLLFQLIEQSESAYYRILSLARTARQGNLKEDAGGWLSHRDYYMLSTIYKLLAPIALFKIIQHNLTFVDLSVDPGIASNYTLAKVLYLTFTCDFELATEKPEIVYEPFAKSAYSRCKDNPQQFWRQGIPLGCLDNVLDECLLSDDKPSRLRTFGDFERVLTALLKVNTDSYINLFFEIFENFHPYTRPVLWRILVTQAHIHRLLIGRVGSRSTSPQLEILSKLTLPPTERSKLQWRNGESSNEPFDVAESFLAKYLKEFQIDA
jgi:hypothetical protein